MLVFLFYSESTMFINKYVACMFLLTHMKAGGIHFNLYGIPGRMYMNVQHGNNVYS